MLEISKQEINLFYCYAREDKTLRDELEKHLSSLKRLYSLRNWHDREIQPGQEWEQAIEQSLNTAHLILLLVSPDFMNSEYCYGKEMQRALERHEDGTCKVIPIILRPTYLESTPFNKLQMLPTDARPITRWSDRDEAFHDVVKGINLVLKDLLTSLKTKKDWLDEGTSFRNLKRYDDALEAFEQALRLDPNFIEAYQGKGLTLHELERYDDALEAFEQALHLNRNLVPLYIAKAQTLDTLERYEDALTAFGQAIRLDPNLADAYIGRDQALEHLGISRKAQEELASQLEETRQQRDEALQQLGTSKKAQEQLANQLQQTQQQLVDQQKQSKQLESELQQGHQKLIDQQKRIEQLERQLEQTQQQISAQLVLERLKKSTIVNSDRGPQTNNQEIDVRPVRSNSEPLMEVIAEKLLSTKKLLDKLSSKQFPFERIAQGLLEIKKADDKLHAQRRELERGEISPIVLFKTKQTTLLTTENIFPFIAQQLKEIHLELQQIAPEHVELVAVIAEDLLVLKKDIEIMCDTSA